MIRKDSPKQYRGLTKRRNRHNKEKIKNELETLSTELKYKPFDIYNENINDPIDFLVVAFHFKKPIMPKEFRKLLLERLGDVFE